MRIALTGASGLVGRAIHRAAVAAGHDVDTLPGYRLGDGPDLRGRDALIHAAFAHAPGKYRGGEGDDPSGFRCANLDGTRRLFDAARRSAVARILFLSSRAIHDGHPPGSILTDVMPPAPTTLYGEVKALAEVHLARGGEGGTALRATGIYGGGPSHKWRDLFAGYLAGQPVAPRVATEVHQHDLALAALLVLRAPSAPPTLNVSDLVLDRRDLLAEVARIAVCDHPLPQRADPAPLRIPDCSGLRALGWRPGGMDLLRKELPGMLDPPRHM